jgi:probable HAF family extracellular repeat protein
MFNRVKCCKTAPRTASSILLTVIVGALCLPLVTYSGQSEKNQPPRYKLIDLGTFGGARSAVGFGSRYLSNRGVVVGAADTSMPDPNFDAVANYFGFIVANPFVEHAFMVQHGVTVDLGALPGLNSSQAFSVNAAGDVVGYSENGVIDPVLGIPEVRAVLWRDGKIMDLGTLGGNESQAQDINNRGQIVGAYANQILDDFSFFGFGTQTRAFIWENGVMQDLGTLGGPDAFDTRINERGQVAGDSYTDWTPNPTTGIPTVHPFLWEDGRMVDLGSLGGSFGVIDWLNNRGQVVGLMTLPTDEVQHPFLWDRGTLTDLGTLGGINGEAVTVNDAGEIAGVADLPDGSHNAFLWKNGVMTDLGNLGVTSFPHGINSSGQIVGASRVSRVPSQTSAFLWEKGGPMVDLNTLIPANSPLHLTFAERINDRGEICGTGVPPGVSVDDVESLGHAFLLIPIGQE